MRPYPNDPYNNESIWPVPYGQLTNVSNKYNIYHSNFLFYDSLSPMYPNFY